MPMVSELGARKKIDEAGFALAIAEAMRDAAGRVPQAAESLGCSERSLFRWLKEKSVKRAMRDLGVKRADVGVRLNPRND